MNFPNLPGARLRVDPTSVGAGEADDAAEIERRLGELSQQDLPPVRPEWIEATVARASAARHGLPGLGPIRRLLAAAVALLGLQGFAAAATVTAIGAGMVVVASVLWTAERNSNETMSYVMALDILRRGDQPEEHRLAALVSVVGRVRAVVTVLRELQEAPDTPPRLAELSMLAIARMKERNDEGLLSDVDEDPILLLGGLRPGAASIAEQERVLVRCVASALRSLQTIDRAPGRGDPFDMGRHSSLRRLGLQIDD